jgi:hypothetical protein
VAAPGAKAASVGRNHIHDIRGDMSAMGMNSSTM